ncbi:hypothetical protein ACGFIW_01395 [Micromonospora sp. NPDC048935]|uniref:hypothetical protein n=1 Tax=Micromonospora sp. NPDC048935 TaxID=3364262 RepID=UPI00371B0330
MRQFFIAYQYERSEPGGIRIGLANCIQRFAFHPLTDPGRAGAEIAAAAGIEAAIVINVQAVPCNDF